MQASDIIFYLAILIGGLILYMFRPSKPQRPSELDMTGSDPQKSYSNKQLPGAKIVKAQVMSEENVVSQDGGWASPTILAEGKMKDAYAILGLESGAPINQVRAQMAELLKQKNSPAKIELIKRAYQAIVDADKA